MTEPISETTFNVIYGYKCNYSCEGCCVGSNHVKDTAQDPDLDITLQAIEILPSVIKIREHDDYWQNGMITLLGGEPMMYWHERIIPLARQIRKFFPRARLNIFSNGHLLHKHTEEIIDFIDEINANITISQHFIGDLSSTVGQKWSHNMMEFLTNPRVVKIDNEHYHIKNNIRSNIHMHVGSGWFTWYREELSGKIKPYASGNPAESMRYGCASGSTCSSLYENRLYKCSSLAMLPGLLSSLGQIDDQDWRPYLDYPYVDVLSIDPVRLNDYRQTYGKPIAQCDMCNHIPSNVMRWIDRRQHSII